MTNASNEQIFLPLKLDAFSPLACPVVLYNDLDFPPLPVPVLLYWKSGVLEWLKILPLAGPNLPNK